MSRKKISPAENELVFKIGAFTPKTMPLDRIAQYIGSLAEMLGNESGVHLLKVGRGSCALNCFADPVVVPKIKERANGLNDGTAPRQALKAKAEVDEMLAADNTSGVVSLGADNLIIFPGNKRAPKDELGPIARPSTIDGAIWSIGGKDETINVQLRDHGQDLKCVVSVAMALRLAPYLFGRKLRLSGMGQWYRTDGSWHMKSLVADDFLELDGSPLETSIGRIRDMLEGVSPEDFLNTMEEIRQG